MLDRPGSPAWPGISKRASDGSSYGYRCDPCRFIGMPDLFIKLTWLRRLARDVFDGQVKRVIGRVR